MDAFIGEIRAFGFGYYPQGWLLCNGQQVAIQEFQALYALISDFYGPSDHRTYFSLPNLQGSATVGVKSGSPYYYSTGLAGGTETVTLTANQLPEHKHVAQAFRPTTAAQRDAMTNQPNPSVHLSYGFSKEMPAGVFCYSDYEKEGSYLNAGTLGNAMPNGQPHENRMPYLVMNYCICFDGTWPPRP